MFYVEIHFENVQNVWQFVSICSSHQKVTNVYIHSGIPVCRHTLWRYNTAAPEAGRKLQVKFHNYRNICGYMAYQSRGPFDDMY